MTTKNEQHWTFEKKVQLPLLLALILQTVAAVWWAATIDSRITQAENNINGLRTRAEVHQSRLEESALRLTRIEERSVLQLDSLRRMEEQFRRVEEAVNALRTGAVPR